MTTSKTTTASASLPLTPREQEVLNLIAYEHSTKEIASILHVCFETVSSHRQNLLRKLAVKNTAGLVRVAFERRILRISNSHHEGDHYIKKQHEKKLDNSIALPPIRYL